MIIEVLLDQGLKKPLDYQVPEGLSVSIGMRVEVPVRSGTQTGTISKIKKISKFPNVRSLSKLLTSHSLLTDTQWKLASFMEQYYLTPLQRILKCFIPPSIRKNTQAKKRSRLTLKTTQKEALQTIAALRQKAPKAAELLDTLLQNKGSLLAKEHSKSAAETLIKKGLITKQQEEIPEDFELEADFFQVPPKKLQAEQQTVLEALEYSLEKKTFEAHLIQGVTGSGKTEVYLQAIQKALSLGKSALFLVPEVSLTSQTIERLRTRFEEKLAVLHHRRSLGERNSALQGLREGKIRLAIGARSAIFCPIQNLGLIIVDEEHDSSYKQSEEMPCYHARDVAVLRASLESCTVVLGSATPSIESRHNAGVGKYHYHRMEKRATKASLPSVQILDMKASMDRQGGFSHFSSELLNGIKERAEKGEQTLLFLNKRGYYRTYTCLECRTSIHCPHCDLSLTFHKQEALLRCHLCSFQQSPPRTCPSCQSASSLKFQGFGTEHVEKSLQAIFPHIRTLRMDRDTTQKKKDHEMIFKQFRAHKADVLIGTQMIAKGFHFPAVTLVGILNADAALHIPDFRSAEKVFQMLTQVAGRAGRADLSGEVILQTFLPDHPVLRLAKEQQYDTFYNQEIEERTLFNYPPFSHLIKLLISAKKESTALKEAEKLHQTLQKKLPDSTHLFPLIPSGHAKVKDLYRFQCLIKTPKISLVSPHLRSLTPPSSIHLKIDVDPLSTFF